MCRVLTFCGENNMGGVMNTSPPMYTSSHPELPVLFSTCADIQLVFDSLRALFLRESATLQDTFDSALPELVMQEVLLLGWNCVVYTVEMLEKLTGGAVLDKPTVCVNNLAALYRFFDALEHPLLQQSLKAIDVVCTSFHAPWILFISSHTVIHPRHTPVDFFR